MSLNTTKPTANTTSGTVTNPAYAYDGAVNDTATAANMYAYRNTIGAATSTEIVKTFPAMAVQAYSSKILKYNISVDYLSDPGGNGAFFKIEVSTNSGGSYSIAKTLTAITGEQTYSYALAANQDETSVWVRITAQALSDGINITEVSGLAWDFWIEGTYNVGGQGKKAVAAIGA